MCLIASKHPAAFARLYPMNLLTWLTAQAAGLGLVTDMSPKQKDSVDNNTGPNSDLTVVPYGCSLILQMRHICQADDGYPDKDNRHKS